MHLSLTKQGRLFGVILALLSAASLTSQSALLLLPVGIVLGCYLLNAVHAARTASRCHVDAPENTHLAEGQRVSQPWRMVNLGRQMAQFLSVETSGQSLLRVAAIAPGASTYGVPDLVYLRRGVYALKDLRLTCTAPFGLVKASRSLSIAGEVVVHPAVFHTTAPMAAGFDAVVGGKHGGKRQTPSGALFAGVRPFQPGDPFKHVHWKSSAKGADLMVKTFDEELSGRVAMILDAGHTGNETTLDEGLRAAGSLLFAALDEGHHVEWIDLGRMEAGLVPPFDDGQKSLDALARLRMERGCMDEKRLREALGRCSLRAALCFVVTDCPPALKQLLEELVLQRRKLSVYLPESGAEVSLPAGVLQHRFGPHSIRQVS